jgi:uncharacterized protein DUF397
VTAGQLHGADWHISTYSANGSTCVEVARNLPAMVAVRDSQDRNGPVLILSPGTWQAFTTAMKTGTIHPA